jgi:hypothetical protein
MAFNKNKYDQEYNKAHITRKFIPFNDQNPDDKELLSWLSGIENVTQYIKGLIRADMENTNIVRCNDCEKQGTYDCHITSLTGQSSSGDWFCADGKMRNKDVKNRDS